MFRAYKYRIYPNSSQEELINKHIGASRFLYNLALETKTTAYIGSNINLSRYDLQAQIIGLKEECHWLKEINSQTLQVTLINLEAAYRSFYKGGGFPKYKSKHKGSQSFSVPQNVIVDSEKSELIIPKFKKKGIKIVIHREIKGAIKSATISRTPTGKYFASILVDTNRDFPNKSTVKKDTTIGVDLGIKDFLITSNGVKIENPKNLRKAQGKLKYIQRKYSKNKGSRTKKRLSMLHEKVANKRKDFLHKTSTKLIRESQTIALEDLNVKGMMKNHKLSQAISDVGWSMFVDMLKYKADWHGKNILRIDRFAPSSKTCSNCGYINRELQLKDREWSCVSCKSLHDRDLNAAINIKSFAINKHLSTEHTLKNQNELPTLVGVLTSEASTLQGSR